MVHINYLKGSHYQDESEDIETIKGSEGVQIH